jgi:hypothetical protein
MKAVFQSKSSPDRDYDASFRLAIFPSRSMHPSSQCSSPQLQSKVVLVTDMGSMFTRTSQTHMLLISDLILMCDTLLYVANISALKTPPQTNTVY